MKDPKDRCKVVVRHLPPTLSQAAFKDQIDMRFSERYDWFAFRPGKPSHRMQIYSRVYLSFKRTEDVIEFAEIFNGHVFVNEKGTQYKAIVEYAPSQRVPKTWNKKDAREGSILNDEEYLKFLEMLSKPTENLPSADIQLERKEAERAASGMKDHYVVTPLMDFVRQKRAAKNASRLAGRRSGGVTISSGTNRRGVDRRKSTAYVLRDSSKASAAKEKSTYVLVSRQDDHAESDLQAQSPKMNTLEDDSSQTGKNLVPGLSISSEPGKKKLVLLSKKERESVNGRILEASLANSSTSSAVAIQKRQTASTKGSSVGQQYPAGSNHQSLTSPIKGSSAVSSIKHQRREPTGRVVKGASASKDMQQQSLSAEHQNHLLYLQRDPKKSIDELASDMHATLAINDKQDRRTRNKDRPDRPVWAARRRPNGLRVDETSAQANFDGLARVVDSEGNMAVENIGGTSSGHVRSHISESIATLAARSSQSSSSVEQSLYQGETKTTKMIVRTGTIGDGKIHCSGRSTNTVENGIHRQILRRPIGPKDMDGPPNGMEAKPSKRNNASSYGGHEKQVWVAIQKSGSSS